MSPAAWTRVRRLLGLGLRARTVVVGVPQVRVAVQKGRVECAVVADDASPHSRSKVVPLMQARRVQVVDGVTAAELGYAVGRQQVAVVAVLDRSLARGIREAISSAGS
jgi:ribosomal protein L7Ae-like RNA K-turn-binding protein